MANILIIDDQEWVKNLCKQGLAGEGHKVSTTDDVEDVSKSILSFKPHVVLLNQYLKYGFLVWDVLHDIKTLNQNLPVLIVTKYDTQLFGPNLSQADGHIVKSHIAADELRQKISAILDRKPAVRGTEELGK